MRVTKTEYSSMTDKASKNSSLLKDCSCAFLVGGAICTIGHSLFLMYRSFGLQEIDRRNCHQIICTRHKLPLI